MKASSRLARSTAILLFLATAACGGEGGVLTPAPTPTPTPPPTGSTPTPTPTSYNVERCFEQLVAPGVSVRSLLIPDTVKIDLSKPADFPNGRRLQDQVVDVTLAELLLDLTRYSPKVLADLPLNPGKNDATFLTVFPYLAPPNGVRSINTGGSTSFDFRTDPDSAYVSVDRMGMPAVATALIRSAQKTNYNDSTTQDDVNGKFIEEQKGDLTDLHNQLEDDLKRLSLDSCAVPA